MREHELMRLFTLPFQDLNSPKKDHAGLQVCHQCQEISISYKSAQYSFEFPWYPTHRSRKHSYLSFLQLIHRNGVIHPSILRKSLIILAYPVQYNRQNLFREKKLRMIVANFFGTPSVYFSKRFFGLHATILDHLSEIVRTYVNQYLLVQNITYVFLLQSIRIINMWFVF